MHRSLQLLLFSSLEIWALNIVPITLTRRAPEAPTKTRRDLPVITNPTIVERGFPLFKRKYIEACPTPGVSSGCQLIGIDEVLGTQGGHYVPTCDDEGNCHYIGYADPTYEIDGPTSAEVTTSSGDVYAFPVPLFPPIEEPPPPPPPDDPELKTSFKCSLEYTTTTATDTDPAQYDPAYFTSMMASDKDILSKINPWNGLAAAEASASKATASIDCMADGAPWFSPTRSVMLITIRSMTESFLTLCFC